jgi:hypothetical protein
MHLSYREWWALIHGIIFGAFFLLAFRAASPDCGAFAPNGSPRKGCANACAGSRSAPRTPSAWNGRNTSPGSPSFSPPSPPAPSSTTGAHLARNRTIRNIVIGFFGAAFATAAAAGIFGALITKAAPVH